jgi:hypothetical protein
MSYAIYLISPLFLTGLFFNGCVNPPFSNTTTQEYNNSIPINVNSIHDNKWADKNSWGRPFMSVDPSSTTLFKDDTRIDDLHKNELPDFAEHYVLWRMAHDGSCWVSSATTLLFYHMIAGGPQKYNKVLAGMKTLANSHGDMSEEFYKEFFDIFELIKDNFSHEFAIYLRNRLIIYEKLVQGMRMLLIAFLESQGAKDISTKKRIAKIKKPSSWGYTHDFYDLFDSLEITCPIIDIGNAGSHFISLIFKEAHVIPRPTMIIFHGRRAFIDVLVEKNFSFSLKHL